LLFAGRLSQNKGVQYAIEALTKLPGRFSLRIVGDGWFRPSLERIAQRLGVAKRITFSGAAETTGMHVVYNDADILLVPSIWPEPAGLVIPEARAQGLRVAAFAVGGIPYWLSAHGLDGVFLARPSDVDSLLSAIYRALSGAVGDYLPPSPAPEDFLDALVAIGTELHVGA
jgi:glycosyltransferase involved in cell wall biosynthesis